MAAPVIFLSKRRNWYECQAKRDRPSTMRFGFSQINTESVGRKRAKAVSECEEPCVPHQNLGKSNWINFNGSPSEDLKKKQSKALQVVVIMS